MVAMSESILLYDANDLCDETFCDENVRLDAPCSSERCDDDIWLIDGDGRSERCDDTWFDDDDGRRLDGWTDERWRAGSMPLPTGDSAGLSGSLLASPPGRGCRRRRRAAVMEERSRAGRRARRAFILLKGHRGTRRDRSHESVFFGQVGPAQAENRRNSK